MAFPGVGTQSESTFARWIPAFEPRVVGVAVAGLLALAILNYAAGGPGWLHAWHVAAAFLMVAAGLVIRHYITVPAEKRPNGSESARVSILLVGLAVLLVVTYQSRTPGVGFELHRPVELWLIYAVVIGCCVLAGDPREYNPFQWIAVGCFTVVLGIYFYHGLSVPAASTRARHPIWGGVVWGVGMFVLPQYVRPETFFWAVNRLAALVVLVALPVYLIGEYSLYGLQMGFHGSIPYIEVDAIRGFFVHRNAFGVVAFAGILAGLGEIHLLRKGDRHAPRLAVPAILLVVTATGLVLSFGRALWVIAPMLLGIYAAYVFFGRRVIPMALIAGAVYLAVGIGAVHTGLVQLPEGTPTRAPQWYPSLAAVLDNPSLFGAGLVDPGAFIAPYHPEGSTNSPHNAYLTIWIRTGIVGVIAYLGLTATVLFQGVARYREVSVATLLLAVGFAAHQLFEAYTLFGWGSSTVIAVLAFGFLVFGPFERDPAQESDPS